MCVRVCVCIQVTPIYHHLLHQTSEDLLLDSLTICCCCAHQHGGCTTPHQPLAMFCTGSLYSLTHTVISSSPPLLLSSVMFSLLLLCNCYGFVVVYL